MDKGIAIHTEDGMGSGLLFLTIGMLFITGIFCLVIALNQLSAPAAPTNVKPMPVSDKDEEDDQPKTRLGRPVEEVRLRA